jgi:hypothetical protein
VRASTNSTLHLDPQLGRYCDLVGAIHLLGIRWKAVVADKRSHTSSQHTIMPTMEELYGSGPSAPPGQMDRCAGCNASNVALLVCDDISYVDGKGAVADPSQRAR